MSRPARRPQRRGTIPHRLRVERVRPIFTGLASLSPLDLAKISRRERMDLEIGHLSTGRCRHLVRAIRGVTRGYARPQSPPPCSPWS
jgi:hypothetical protein